MTLTGTAYLEIDDGSGTTATFEFSSGLEETLEGQKTYIMGDRGRFLQEIADNAVQLLSMADIIERRKGFTIDGGAGSITRTIHFDSTLGDVRWGDGTGGKGESNVTETDASGEEIPPLVRRDVLAYWLKRTRTDSVGYQSRLHWGEWTNGDISGISGVSAAAHNQPVPVSILEWNLPSPPVGGDPGPSAFSGSITMKEIALFPLAKGGVREIPDWVTNPAQKIMDQIEGVDDRA